jgi:hypothetical protein
MAEGDVVGLGEDRGVALYIIRAVIYSHNIKYLQAK